MRAITAVGRSYNCQFSSTTCRSAPCARSRPWAAPTIANSARRHVGARHARDHGRGPLLQMPIQLDDM